MLCGWERDTGILGTGRGKASQEQRTDRGKIGDIWQEKENWRCKLPFFKPIDRHLVTACVSKHPISQASP